jgi:hypothetical protein
MGILSEIQFIIPQVRGLLQDLFNDIMIKQFTRVESEEWRVEISLSLKGNFFD